MMTKDQKFDLKQFPNSYLNVLRAILAKSAGDKKNAPQP